jgi:ethanolamine utilization protein EutN
MQIAMVVGTLVATRKHAALHGAKLLLVQPQTPEGEPRGPVLLAIDSVGAGIGERVLVVIEGKAAGDALGQRGAPVDAAIIGIVDRVDDVAAAEAAALLAAS